MVILPFLATCVSYFLVIRIYAFFFERFGIRFRLLVFLNGVHFLMLELKLVVLGNLSDSYFNGENNFSECNPLTQHMYATGMQCSAMHPLPKAYSFPDFR